jgi:hypothetical protein
MQPISHVVHTIPGYPTDRLAVADALLDLRIELFGAKARGRLAVTKS